MDNIIFELKNVSFSYLGKYPALRGIDMAIKKGQKAAVIGANGTGKSTLLEVLDGLIFPDSGTVKTFGEELTESALADKDFLRNFRSKVGFVFQNSDVQLFCPTVKEDILFGPLQLGLSPKEANARLEALMEIIDIRVLLDRPPHHLSMGEKKKAAILSSLAIEPEVLILDEPTAGLDPATVRQIIDAVIDANSFGKTIITATHDLHIVEEIADIVYVFGSDRRICRYGDAAEILKDTEFLKANNLVHIHSHRHKEQIHIHSHSHIEHHVP